MNAWILHNLTTEKPRRHLDYRLAVAKALLEGHSPQSQKQYCPTRELPLRLTKAPFSKQLHPVATCNVKCVELEVKKSQTQVRRKICKTPLHAYECFEIYHTY